MAVSRIFKADLSSTSRQKYLKGGIYVAFHSDKSPPVFYDGEMERDLFNVGENSFYMRKILFKRRLKNDLTVLFLLLFFCG